MQNSRILANLIINSGNLTGRTPGMIMIISLADIDRKNDWWILRINDCTVDDEGKYVAVARNRIGQVQSTCLVILSNKNPVTYITDV